MLFLNEFRIIKELGSGSYGMVFLALKESTQENVFFIYSNHA